LVNVSLFQSDTRTRHHPWQAGSRWQPLWETAFAPKLPEVFALRAGAERQKAESQTLPLCTATEVGARAALQRFLIFRFGALILSQQIA